MGMVVDLTEASWWGVVTEKRWKSAGIMGMVVDLTEVSGWGVVTVGRCSVGFMWTLGRVVWLWFPNSLK